MKKIKISFIGCVNFSAQMLNEIIINGYKPTLVITKKASNFNSDFFDLAPICVENNIKYVYTNDVNSNEILNEVREHKPDVVFCFGWSSLIKKDFLEIPTLGVLGFHPALIPENKGRHPIIWALALGLKQTGSTFFFMDEGADTGDIISQVKLNVDIKDNASILYDKIIATSKTQIHDILIGLENDSYSRQKQNLNKGNSWRKRTKKDGEIDFRMSSMSIYNLVRSLDKPYPGSHFILNNEEIKVWKVKIGNETSNNIEPGKVLEIKKDKIQIKTGDGTIWLLNHELLNLPTINTYIK
jgi:methionyl-tRNA formyltransferase|tara:strand:+ start:134 stop:1027 length:894 start_codon:yes stop_codon:yes gene_type:complete